MGSAARGAGRGGAGGAVSKTIKKKKDSTDPVSEKIYHLQGVSKRGIHRSVDGAERCVKHGTDVTQRTPWWGGSGKRIYFEGGKGGEEKRDVKRTESSV